MKKTVDSNGKCKARQHSDQMVCECGNRFDVNDPAPPECKDLPITFARRKAELQNILKQKIKEGVVPANSVGVMFTIGDVIDHCFSAPGIKFTTEDDEDNVDNLGDFCLEITRECFDSIDDIFNWRKDLMAKAMDPYKNILSVPIHTQCLQDDDLPFVNLDGFGRPRTAEEAFQVGAGLARMPEWRVPKNPPHCLRPDNCASLDSSDCVVCVPRIKTSADVLEGMAATFRERNAAYKDGYVLVPKLIEILFPEGISKELLFDKRWHIFELIIVKLTRFAASNLEHQDSIHDIGVYSAMLESFIINNSSNDTKEEK